MKKDKYKVGIIGATGMVGQRFITLLADIRGMMWLCLRHRPEVQVKHIRMQ